MLPGSRQIAKAHLAALDSLLAESGDDTPDGEPAAWRGQQSELASSLSDDARPWETTVSTRRWHIAQLGWLRKVLEARYEAI